MRALLLASLVLALGACAEGPVGPEGPPGPGVEVTFIDLDASDFSSSSGSSVEGADYSVSTLTSDVVDDGLVVAYTDLGGDGWFALPITLPVDLFLTVEYGYAYGVGELTFLITRSSGNPVAESVDGHRLKVITAPPGSGDLDGVDLHDHGAVVRALGISAQ